MRGGEVRTLFSLVTAQHPHCQRVNTNIIERSPAKITAQLITNKCLQSICWLNNIFLFCPRPFIYFQIANIFKTTIEMIPEDSSVLVVKGEHLNYFVILLKEYCWLQKSVNLLTFFPQI